MGALSRSLSARLILSEALEAGARGISIALLNQSVDCTLQIYFSNRLLRQLGFQLDA